MQSILGKKSRRAVPPPRRRVRRILKVLLPALAAVPCVTVLLVLPGRWIAPPTTAFMLRERVASEDPVHYRWVSWDQIAPVVAISAVAAEDQKFPVHSGFDWDSIQQALDERASGQGDRGASTITQQVAKNLYLWPGQSWIRKGAEAWFTVWIELLWPKQRILEVYLNVAEFGSGVFGVGEASERLRGKPASALTGFDAAVLVAVLPSPKRMSAASPSDYVRMRAGEIQVLVGRLGGAGYLDGM